ncbi:beta-N-acetylhexosaminidase [Fulvivirgaceae bacterium BMA12]|uniref:beta-N-acetylhexosaminidase n=1 Tax=Agaribacillus aureus TaxID=3051825 RepID=A0ABT8LDG4_9BACT|nr:beta-N-acetylhexosaminidase [Fulvivirgaceae bacterium BMA12]
MLRIKFCTVILLCSFAAKAQIADIKIIPEPSQLQVRSGNFTLDKNQTILLGNNFLVAMPEVKLLQQLITRKTGLEIPVVTGKSTKNTGVHIFRDPEIQNRDGYVLHIDVKGIHLKAADRTGLFYAIQTLAQLFPVPIENKPMVELPYVSIIDSPRFEYRALMLDPARHFLPIPGIKKYIDAMASYKFNYLHLHLTDDHGWRVEIKKYPLLTEIGSRRKETNGDGIPHEGFYTQEQLKELVLYAKNKQVEIVPEIDMPGHGLSILAAYPDLACFPQKFELSTVPGVSKELLCVGKEEVYQFYEDVIAEIATIFPNPKIHLGGDEAPLDQWEKSSHCQLAIQKHGLKNEEALMAHFFDRINRVLIKHNKEPLLWYESNVERYPENSTVILWRNEEPDVKMREIQSRGLRMINAYGKNAYFDYPQWKGDIPNVNWMPVLSLENAYAFDPVRGLSEKESQFIVGVEGCVWGEYVPNIERAFYMTYPRALALAEVGWSKKENLSWEHFKKKLDKHFINLISDGVPFRPPAELSD